MRRKQRGPLELAGDGDRLIDWLRREEAAQRERSRFVCLLGTIVASGYSLVLLATGEGLGVLPTLSVAALCLVVLIASRRRVEDAARTLIDALRHRPHEVRRIAHVVSGSPRFRKDAVEIQSDSGGSLFVETRDWDVVLNVLAARCRNARVELCGAWPGRPR
jgi:hypothetical protein